MKVFKQCGKCDHYYTTDECEYCRDFEMNAVTWAIDILCTEFKIQIDKFSKFFYKYFPTLDEFKPLHRSTRGSYYKIVASIFYFYVNKKTSTIVPLSRLNGISKQSNFYCNDLIRFIDFTYDILCRKLYKFSNKRITRQFKFNQRVKTILGILKKPIHYDHIAILYNKIGFDNRKVSVNTVAGAYIMLYYNFIRGLPVRAHEIAAAAGTSLKNIEKVYYNQLKPYTLEQDIDPDQTNVTLLMGYI